MLQSCGNNKTVNESAIVNVDTLNVSLSKDLGIDPECESKVYFSYWSDCNIEARIKGNQIFISNNKEPISDYKLFLTPIESKPDFYYNVINEKGQRICTMVYYDNSRIQFHDIEGEFPCKSKKTIILLSDLHFPEYYEDFLYSIEYTKHFDQYLLKAEILEGLGRFDDAALIYNEILKVSTYSDKQSDPFFATLDTSEIKLKLSELPRKRLFAALSQFEDVPKCSLPFDYSQYFNCCLGLKHLDYDICNTIYPHQRYESKEELNWLYKPKGGETVYYFIFSTDENYMLILFETRSEDKPLNYKLATVKDGKIVSALIFNVFSETFVISDNKIEFNKQILIPFPKEDEENGEDEVVYYQIANGELIRKYEIQDDGLIVEIE